MGNAISTPWGNPYEKDDMAEPEEMVEQLFEISTTYLKGLVQNQKALNARINASIAYISNNMKVTTHNKDTNDKGSDETATKGDEEKAFTSISKQPKIVQADQKRPHPSRLLEAMAETKVTPTLVEMVDKSPTYNMFIGELLSTKRRSKPKR